MFSAFFGNYLLEKGVVKPRQLSRILSKQNKTRLKLGMLAINEKYMTAAQVEEIHELQASKDMRFGDLAIEKKYLTKKKLETLLGLQKSEHLVLAQTMVDDGIMTMKQFEKEIDAYKKKYGLSDEQFEALKNNDVDIIVHAFVAFEDTEQAKLYADYVALFVKNIIRFIDGNVRIDRVEKIDNKGYDHMMRQTIHNDGQLFTGIASDESAFLKLAGRYADETFVAIGEYPIDAAGEFLNLHNGLFTVNLSNEGVDAKMDIQSYIEAPILNPADKLYDIPVYTGLGTFHIIIGHLY